MKVDELMDENKELLHANPKLLYAPDNTHDNCCWRLEYLSWWLNSLDMLGNCLNWVSLAPNNLSLIVDLKICPLLICMNPDWTPLGVAHHLSSTSAP